MIDGVCSTGVIARAFGVSPRTVQKWMELGGLKSFRLPVSGQRRAVKADVIAFAADNKLPFDPEVLSEAR